MMQMRYVRVVAIVTIVSPHGMGERREVIYLNKNPMLDIKQHAFILRAMERIHSLKEAALSPI